MNPHFGITYQDATVDRLGGLARIIAAWDRRYLDDYRTAQTLARVPGVRPPRQQSDWLRWANDLPTDGPRWEGIQAADLADRARTRRIVPTPPLPPLASPWRNGRRMLDGAVVAVVYSGFRCSEWKVYADLLPRPVRRACYGWESSEGRAMFAADAVLRRGGVDVGALLLSTAAK